jgi:hypothetical protein
MVALVAAVTAGQVQSISENPEFVAQRVLLEKWIQAQVDFRNLGSRDSRGARPGSGLVKVSDLLMSGRRSR